MKELQVSVCIDPGANSGYCVLVGKKLERWKVVTGKGDTWRERVTSGLAAYNFIKSTWDVFLEWPYGIFSPGKNASILKLVFWIGSFCERHPQTQLVTVQEWKGSLSKEAVAFRVQKYFKQEIKSHAQDAAGIARYLIKKGVIK